MISKVFAIGAAFLAVVKSAEVPAPNVMLPICKCLEEWPGQEDEGKYEGVWEKTFGCSPENKENPGPVYCWRVPRDVRGCYATFSDPRLSGGRPFLAPQDGAHAEYMFCVPDTRDGPCIAPGDTTSAHPVSGLNMVDFNMEVPYMACGIHNGCDLASGTCDATITQDARQFNLMDKVFDAQEPSAEDRYAAMKYAFQYTIQTPQPRCRCKDDWSDSKLAQIYCRGARGKALKDVDQTVCASAPSKFNPVGSNGEGSISGPYLPVAGAADKEMSTGRWCAVDEESMVGGSCKADETGNDACARGEKWMLYPNSLDLGGTANDMQDALSLEQTAKYASIQIDQKQGFSVGKYTSWKYTGGPYDWTKRSGEEHNTGKVSPYVQYAWMTFPKGVTDVNSDRFAPNGLRMAEIMKDDADELFELTFMKATRGKLDGGCDDECQTKLIEDETKKADAYKKQKIEECRENPQCREKMKSQECVEVHKAAYQKCGMHDECGGRNQCDNMQAWYKASDCCDNPEGSLMGEDGADGTCRTVKEGFAKQCCGKGGMADFEHGKMSRPVTPAPGPAPGT